MARSHYTNVPPDKGWRKISCDVADDHLRPRPRAAAPGVEDADAGRLSARRFRTRRRGRDELRRKVLSDELASEEQLLGRSAAAPTATARRSRCPTSRPTPRNIGSASPSCARPCSCTSATSRRCARRSPRCASARMRRPRAGSARVRARDEAATVLAAGGTPRRSRDFDLLATAVLLLDDRGRISYANPAAENLFELSRQKLMHQALPDDLRRVAHAARRDRKRATATGASYTEQELELGVDGQAEAAPDMHGLVDRRRRRRAAARVPPHRPAAEDRARGAAAGAAAGEPRADPQPRARDQESARRHSRRRAAARARARPAAARRVHAGDHRRGRPAAAARQPAARAAPRADVSAHQHPRGAGARERRRAGGVSRGFPIVCDFDTSLPEFDADHEQLMQAALNIVRNAAQALSASRRRCARRSVSSRASRAA